MSIVDKFKQSPLWLTLPSLAVAGVVACVVASYEPLVFDPSQYQTEQARASELKQIDADALENDGAAAAIQAGVERSSSSGTMLDGSWTGYAACGKGNGDGWKPYYVAVSIQVSGGQVTKIGSIEGTSSAPGSSKLDWDSAENQSYLTWAADGRAGSAGVKSQLSAKLPSSAAPSDVDTVSGATYSSIAIYNAYVNAMDNAKGSSGSSTASAKSPGSGKKAKSAKTAPMKAAPAVGTLADGTWTAFEACGKGNEEDWEPYYVGVTVTVKGGKAVSVDKVFGSSTGEKGSERLKWNEAQNKAYLNWAIDGRTRNGKKYAGVVAQIKSAIKAAKSSFTVDAVSGATYSSQAIYSAYYAALKKSAAAAGSNISEPAMVVETPQGSPDSTGGVSGTGGSPSPSDAEVKVNNAYEDGTFFGYAYCRDEDAPSAYKPYYIFLSIETAGGAITQVSEIYGDAEGIVDGAVYDSHENATYLNKAINGFGVRTKGIKAKLQAKIDAGEDVDIGNMKQVDTVSGATWSSRSILDAFAMAAANAASGAGKTPEEVAGTGK